MTELVVQSHSSVIALPDLITDQGSKAENRFIEFFTAQIRNPNTRMAYARDVRHFLDFCQDRGLALDTIRPVDVATWVEVMMLEVKVPTVKRRLAAVNNLFDWLVTGQIIEFNPAASVRGPVHRVRKGKTPALTSEEMRQLLDSIDGDDVVSLRDKALISLMVYSFARVTSACDMNVEDYQPRGKTWWVILEGKGGKHHEMPCHHQLVEALDNYIEAAGIGDDRKGPLFRTVKGGGWTRELSDVRMNRTDSLKAVYRRAKAAGISTKACNHSFRATGITNYLENGGSLAGAQDMADHADISTTRIYDRSGDKNTVGEVERLRF